jgi:Ca2+-binding EF-hand superfamily protein
MTYDTVGGAYGDTEVTINYILLSYEGEWVSASVLNGTAATSIVKYFSPYDLNRSGEVDLNDLTYALMYFMTNSGDAGWDKAKAADFNDDGVVDVMDLILILANYTIPYYG